MSRGMRNKEPVSNYYEAVANDYHKQYDSARLYDISTAYPANYFRLKLLLKSFAGKGIKRAIEIGVGEGTPLVTLGKSGVDVWGLDITPEMVKKSKENMQKHGMNPDQILLGDIQDSVTYAHSIKEGQFDGLVAMGVMPHVENDEKVLENMASLVRPGGSVFVEFRNKLFSMFTFNRYTVDFIINDLLKDVNKGVKDEVARDLESRLRMDMPPVRNNVEDTDAPGYDAILSKFHNPFEVIELFERHKFKNTKLLWYHFHPGMPYLTERNSKLFREEAILLENEPSNWRGFFLCSAFVVEAVKCEQ